MKQTFFITLAVIFIIICIVCIILINLTARKNEIKKENMEYEEYLNKEILGTDIASLISKTMDKNEKNNVPKNDKGYYIDNENDSIKIDLKMSTIDKTYPMEEIYNNEITEFVQNINLINFKCINIEYHTKTGRVSKLVFEELK